jgi:gamma-glutamylcyclotransferase (GGCT)/AIG2-like uncharacterized protein YtfP
MALRRHNVRHRNDNAAQVRTVEHLFVYGTLRRGFRTPMHPLLERYATHCGSAWVHGVLFDLGAYPGLLCDNRAERRVSGELYRLHDPEQLLRRLDHYEGCSPGFRQPTEYVREAVRAEGPDGQTVSVWVYLYNLPIGGARRIRSGDYRRRG